MFILFGALQYAEAQSQIYTDCDIANATNWNISKPLDLAAIYSNTSTTHVLNLVSDFKADGSGSTLDESIYYNNRALRACADFLLSNGGNYILVIPKGTYYVGEQCGIPQSIENNFKYYKSRTVFYLHNTNHVKITSESGLDDVTFIFKEGMRYGGFTGSSQDDTTTIPFAPANTECNIGHLFDFQECSNIELSHLKCDGNLDNQLLGGISGDVGMQRDHSGLFIFDCENVYVHDCTFERFCFDGIQTYNSYSNPLPLSVPNYYFSKVKCNHNGRAGLSMQGGGRDYQIENSTFNHTGYIGTQRSWKFNPACGIDIEPNLSMSNIIFNDDTIQNNAGIGIVNDDQSLQAEHIEFNNCIVDRANTRNSFSIWTRSRKVHFNNCLIKGTITMGCPSNLPGDETTFEQCILETIDVNPALPADIRNDYIYFSDRSGKGTTFKNCIFNVNHVGTHSIFFQSDLNYTYQDYLKLDNSMINYNIGYVSANSYSDANYRDHLKGVVFKGDNKIISHIGNPGHYRILEVTDATVEGSVAQCDASTLNIEGDVIFINHNSPIRIGGLSANQKARINIGEKSVMIIAPGSIGINEINNESAIIVKKEGSLYLSGNTSMDGSIICEKNSYLCMDHASLTKSATTTTPLFFIDANTSFGIHPNFSAFNSSICYGNVAATLNTNNYNGFTVGLSPCVQGTNVNVNPSLVCPPDLFSNISTNGAFPIKYNVATTGSTHSIEYTPSSGLNYFVTLDGLPVGASPIPGVTDGNHTLIITDNNTNCSAVAFIAIGNVNLPCCEPSISNAANLLSFTNPTALDIIALNGSTISNKLIVIDGIFTLDQSMVFDHCTFLMQCDAKIDIDPGQTLTLNACTLKAACTKMWDGIYADDPTEQITIENNSVLQDMENGVNVSNNAKINSTGSTYQDNYFSIQIRNNTLANTCVIISNIFKKESGLLFPHNTDYKPETGIFIADCNNISIGDISQPNSGNTFVDMWNGIYIWSGKGVSYPNASIQLCYNSFNAISGDAGTWDNYTFSTPKGWAVYAHNANPMTNLIVKVKGDNASSTVNFLRCDKGVVLRNTNGEVLNVKMKDTKLGVGLTECQGRSYKINNNEMLNTRNGIVKYGDESSGGFYACNNTMSLYNHYIPNLITSSPPVGIISTYSGTTNIGTSYIQNNTINIPTQTKAVGISMSGGSADFITGNTIHFGTTDGEPELTIPGLLGIYSNKCEAPSIIGNVVDNTSGVNFVPGNNAGIYVNANNNSRLQCNSINYTRWGMFGVGTNGSTSDYTLTASNAMRCSSADFMFWALGSEGTFGQVGRVISTTPPNAYDANNSFLGNPILGKVNRVSTCLGAIAQEQIVTTAGKLNPSESLTSPSGGPCFVPVYNPSQPFTETHNCSSIALALGSNSANIDYNRAMLVAENNIVYEDFEEGARRADEEMVYAWLDAYGSIRASNPILDSFYLNRYSQIVGTIKQLDLQIAMLSDSTLMADSTAWLSKLQIAIQNNNSLGIGQVFEANAKWINNLYLQAIAGGIDSIETEMASEIETLANTCPYLGGNAVFRARAFMGMIKPGTHYDDLVICNGQGVYKNGISKLQQQLLNIANFHNNPLLEEEGLLVYPNPASSDVYIDYDFAKNESARLVFYDLLGNAVKVVELNSNLGNSTIDISNFSNGLYVYQFRSNLGKNYFGKLIVN